MYRGSIRLFGTEIKHTSTAARRAQGLRYVPEERLGHAAVAEMMLNENVVLTGDRLRSRGLVRYAEARRVATVADRSPWRSRRLAPMRRPEACRAATCRSSWSDESSMGEPRVLLASQPTWGVDVGSAVAIRNQLIALRDAGCAILVRVGRPRRAVRAERPTVRDVEGDAVASRCVRRRSAWRTSAAGCRACGPPCRPLHEPAGPSQG